MDLTCDWHGPWHGRGDLFGYVLLNEMRSVTIDAEKVSVRVLSGPFWDEPSFRASVQLPGLAPGKHLLKCEIESAFIAKDDLAGLAKAEEQEVKADK